MEGHPRCGLDDEDYEWNCDEQHAVAVMDLIMMFTSLRGVRFDNRSRGGSVGIGDQARRWA